MYASYHGLHIGPQTEAKVSGIIFSIISVVEVALFLHPKR